MLKFELNIADRKTLANRMEELTGIHPYYTRAPLYAYDIGNYTIDRDGNLLVEPENADAELLTTLLNEGLIRGGESVESTDDQPENTEPTENLAEEPVAEAEPDDTAEDEPDAEKPESEDQPEEVPLDLELAFPTSQHNGVSLRNLVNLIYSRGRLISKATGGHFHVETDLVETLRDDSCTYTVANFIEALKSYEAQCGTAMEGLVITEEKVSFVDSTEIHIAGENNMKRLAWLSVEDYAATQMEMVVVSAMKGYLRRMPEKEALKKVEAFLDPKVIQLFGEGGTPMPLQSNVDGAKLVAFIDAAVADSIMELGKREDDLSKAGVTMLENVDGKSMVEQMSPQFLEFVLDAYRGLKYTQ